MKDYSKFNLEEIIFLKPHFEAKIWGGNYLKNLFKVETEKKWGEAWILSAIQNKESLILNFPEYNLRTLWEKKNYLFNNQSKNYKSFPLLFKILAPEEDLSIQVHPDDYYAKKFNSYGKNESWYIDKIFSKDADQVILNHHANNLKEAKDLIKNENWEKFLEYKKIKEGDVIDIFPGLIHALLKNIVVFELQQSSDITFRLFDYNRKDENGNLRELHIENSLDVLSFEKNISIYNFKNTQENELTKMISNNFYSFLKLKLKKELKIPNNLLEKDFLFFFIKEGKGTINKIDIEKNECFIMPKTVNSIKLEGEMELLIAFNK